MRGHILFLQLLALSAIPYPTRAVFSDEAYQIDYHHVLLGTPQQHTTFFHRPSANSKGSLLYSISQKGVLGAINPKDGSIIWRQSLGDTGCSEVSTCLLGAMAEGSTIFSAVDGLVQAWDAAEGRLVWEQPDIGVPKDLVVSKPGGTAKDIFTLTAKPNATNIIRKLKADSGEILWEFEDDR